MNTIKRLSIMAIALAAVFTALSILAFCIPTSAVRGNVEESARQIESDGLWYKPLGFYLFQIDNSTDCIMLRINATADSSRPVYAAMMAEQYECATDTAHPYYEVTKATARIAHNGRRPGDKYSTYARYWHGYQTLLRPLLTVFTYHTIIAINYAALWLLAILTCLLTYRRLGKTYAWTLAASLAITNFFIVPLALQFSTCYYIAFIAMAVLLKKPDMASDKGKCLTLFFSVGALTAYMDFLTTPLLTLGMPLVCLIAMRRNYPTANEERSMKDICANSLSWMAGYSLLWAAKWLIGWMLTGEDILSSAIGNAMLRTGDTLYFGGNEMLMTDAIRMLLGKIPTTLLAAGCVMMAATAITAIVYACRHKQQIRRHGWLLVIGAMPLLWFAVMKNHSLQHIFFTWRDFLLTLWCIAIFAATCISNRRKGDSPKHAANIS